MSLERLDFGSAPNTATGDTGSEAFEKLDNNLDRIENTGFKRNKVYGWDASWGQMSALQDSIYKAISLRHVKYIFKHPFSVNSGADFSQTKYIKPTKKALFYIGLSAASGDVDIVVKVQRKAPVTSGSGTVTANNTLSLNIPRYTPDLKPYIYLEKGTGKGNVKIETLIVNPTTLADVYNHVETFELDNGESVSSVKHFLPIVSSMYANGRGGMLYGFQYRLTALVSTMTYGNYGAGTDGTLTTVHSQTINPSTDLVGGFYIVDIDEKEDFNYVELEINYNAVNVTVNKTYLKAL